jgi:hypothetical protein
MDEHRPQEEESLVGARAEAPGGKPVKVRAGSLLEFLQLDGAKAQHFLADVNAGLVALDQRDFDDAAGLVGRKPRLLLKVHELVRISLGKRGRASDKLLRFAQLALQAQDRELADWLGTESTVGALGQLADWARRRIIGTDKDFKAKGANVLAIGVLILLEQRSLDPVIALREVARAVRPTAGQESAPSRTVLQLLRKAKPAQLAQFGHVARLHLAAVEEANGAVQQERQSAAEARSELGRIHAELLSLRQEVSRRDEMIAASEAMCRELQGKLDSARRLGAHDVGDLRARYRRIFEAEINPIAADAWDSLDVGKLEFAKDFLNQLRARIEEEIRWLNSSSD